jgi:hypothetical protein
MTQILDFLATNPDCILCCYVNATRQLQIVRISNIPRWHLERTVFPGQRLLFEALPQAQLEVHTSDMASAVLADRILCAHLRVKEGHC